MADYKGIAGAFSKAGAALTDSAQGTQFYKEALDREKEERAREFALDQLAEKKKQLDNENAKQSLNSLVQAFGAKLQGIQSDPLNINPGHTDAIMAEGQALLNQVVSNTALSDVDKQYAAAIMNAYRPQMQAIADSGVINTITKTENSILGAENLTEAQLFKFSQTPAGAEAINTGEQAFSEFTSILPEETLLIPAGPMTDIIRALRPKEGEEPIGSFKQLMVDDNAMATQLLKQDLSKFKTIKAKSRFMRTTMEADRQKVSNQFTELHGDLRTLFSDVDMSAFDAVFAPENLYVDEAGVVNYRKAPVDVVYEQLRPIASRIESGDLKLESLIRLRRQANDLEARFPSSGLPTVIAEALSQELGTVAGDAVAEAAESTTQDKLDALDNYLANRKTFGRLQFQSPSQDPAVANWFSYLNTLDGTEEQEEELALARQLGEFPTEVYDSAKEQFDQYSALSQEMGGRNAQEAIRRTVQSIWRKDDEIELLEMKKKQLDMMFTKAVAVQPEEAGFYALAEGSVTQALEQRKFGLHEIYLGYLRGVLEGGEGADPKMLMLDLIGKTTDPSTLNQSQLIKAGEDPSFQDIKTLFMANALDLDIMMRAEGIGDRGEVLKAALDDFDDILETMELRLQGEVPGKQMTRIQQGFKIFGLETRDALFDSELQVAYLLTQIL